MKQIIAILTTLLLATQAQASWLSEMVDEATNSYSGTQSYETQKMGYNSLGGVQYRIPLRRDPLVSVAPPSFNVGCGGIDVFLGGIGFMDADYLVEKLKRSLKAAPYVAFDLGLKSLCSECSEVIKSVEQIANTLNSMDFDECAVAKGAVTTVVDGASTIAKDGFNLSSTMSSMTQNVKSGMGSFWEDIKPKNRDESNKQQDAAIERLPTSIAKTWLKDGGSLLDLLGTEFSIDITSIRIARAYFGDIYLDKDDNDFISVSVCEDSRSTSMDRAIYSPLLGRTVSGRGAAVSTAACRPDDVPMAVAIDAMDKIATSLKTDGAIDSNTATFINKTRLPVFALLQRSYSISEVHGDTVKAQLTPLVAGGYVYEPLASVASSLLLALDDIESEQKTNELYGESNMHTREYREKVFTTIEQLKTIYIEQLRQHNEMWNVMSAIKVQDEQVARNQIKVQ
jgi:conjugative transfer pilus assembly protein TraH